MTKRFLNLELVICLAVAGVAIVGLSSRPVEATDSIEVPVQRYTAPYLLWVPSHVYVNANNASAQALENLSGLLVLNPRTNNQHVYGHIGNCTSTSISTQTIKGPIEAAPGSGTVEIRMAADACLWLNSNYTVSGETITVQGISQKR